MAAELSALKSYSRYAIKPANTSAGYAILPYIVPQPTYVAQQHTLEQKVIKGVDIDALQKPRETVM
ncbi:hypothetical protein L2729_04520 [Shewanella gelidimarina]|uniref:hypothetical protein n=1 Tax=Shewanella gelidimarina TaxID=56813 RepID=UPI00200FABF3|nr:hypothetical protein [Shewanella gelidimarina]MCL1057258.1 hypothetical protein [Shewanella gelidimarina]